MQAVSTEYDLIAQDISAFTETIVGITEMRDVPVSVRADSIFAVESLFHKFIMSKIIEKCENSVTPSNN
jgi:hypothetical protein